MEKNEYTDLIKQMPPKKIEIKSSRRRQAWKKQNGICPSCKNRLHPFYSKFIQTSPGEFLVLCLNCAEKIKTK